MMVIVCCVLTMLPTCVQRILAELFFAAKERSKEDETPGRYGNTEVRVKTFAVVFSQVLK